MSREAASVKFQEYFGEANGKFFSQVYLSEESPIRDSPNFAEIGLPQPGVSAEFGTQQLGLSISYPPYSREIGVAYFDGQNFYFDLKTYITHPSPTGVSYQGEILEE